MLCVKVLYVSNLGSHYTHTADSGIRTTASVIMLDTYRPRLCLAVLIRLLNIFFLLLLPLFFSSSESVEASVAATARAVDLGDLSMHEALNDDDDDSDEGGEGVDAARAAVADKKLTSAAKAAGIKIVGMCRLCLSAVLCLTAYSIERGVDGMV